MLHSYEEYQLLLHDLTMKYEKDKELLNYNLKALQERCKHTNIGYVREYTESCDYCKDCNKVIR